MSEASAIIILASGQFVPELLGVELGVHRRRRRRGGSSRIARASNGERLPASEDPWLRNGQVSRASGGETGELNRDCHVETKVDRR